MPEAIRDLVTVEVLWQGQGYPYRVRMEVPGGGVYAADLDPPVLSRLEREASAGGADPEAYGRKLFEALFGSELAVRFGAARGAAGERGIRLLLRLDERAPGLTALPWEWLQQPEGEGWRPLVLAPDIVFARYLPDGSDWGLPITGGPLRVLAVISNPYPPGNPLHLDAEAERQAISRAFARFPDRVHCEVLPGPVTLQAIAEALEAGQGYDVLHYAGHGAWDAEAGQASLILEEPAAGGVRPVSVLAAEITDRLQSLRQAPHLIALFACETAAAAPPVGEHGLWAVPDATSSLGALLGMGPRLAREGCPAVLCMQGSLADEIARDFAERFYAVLLETGVVDLAVQRARAAVRQRRSTQWALPVLFMRLAHGVLFRPELRFVPKERRPYKGLLPYLPYDADLFKGRNNEVAEVCDRIADFPLTVIHGEPGVGMTSLLAAGVRPALASQGDLVIPIGDSADLAHALRAGLATSGPAIQLHVAGDATPAELLRSVAAQPFRHLVLLIDQAERIIDLPQETQERLIAGLSDCLDALGEALRIVFAVHVDRQPALFDLLRALCRWQLATVPLPPLSPHGAEEAIVEPLRALGWPVTLVPQSLAADQIVPELAELSGKEGRVDPSLLQIVCDRLYREALTSGDGRAITEHLYARVHWAEGILAASAEEALGRLGADRPAAEQVLAGISAVRTTRWVPEDRLTGNGPDRARTRALVRLVEADLLLTQRVDGQRVYAFANVVVARKAEWLRATEEQTVAEGEIDRAWSAWVDAKVLATPGQLRRLRYLIGAGARPALDPRQALLLLRSAVARGETLDPWLNRLDMPDCRALITQLEHPAAPMRPEDRVGRSTLQKAAEVLATTPPCPGETGEPYGPVATAAAAPQADVAARRTAALALSALGPHEALDRLRWALEAGLEGWRRHLRQLELRGALIDAHPRTPEYRAALAGADRAGIWLWRVWRRIVHDRRRVANLIVGGAVGAGVGLALLRGLTAALLSVQLRPGLEMAMSLFWGLLLGAALTFGMLLGQVLQPDSVSGDETRRGGWQPPRRTLLSISLGALCFGIMQAGIAAMIGLRSTMAVPGLAMSFVAGLGLSAALSGLPAAGWRLGAGGWLLRLAPAALGFMVSHLPFLASRYAGGSLAIVWAGITYCANFPRTLAALWPRCDQQLALLAALGLADAALVGVCLAFGISAGLLVADRWFRRWLVVSARAGD